MEPSVTSHVWWAGTVHELALADAVVKAAIRAADDQNLGSLDRVVVKVGELQQIDDTLLRYALVEVVPTTDDRLSATVFEIESEPVGFVCRRCGTHFGRTALEEVGNTEALEAIHLVPELAHTFVRCPQCTSPDFDLTAGRGVTLVEIGGRSADELP
jgi:hydrogenase nickel incorporation protein HypA/HybF